MTEKSIDEACAIARQKLLEAEAVLITAGAGMGVDSGLPDFRGTEGFWNAYPPYRKLGLDFVSMANPDHFIADPSFAWGFYGHRFNLYRETEPHRGFALLRGYAKTRPCGYFIFTSNVDGHFERAGFSADRVIECHGSILHWQCLENCSDEVFAAAGSEISIDESTMRARDPLPNCPACGALARPAILMFGDSTWNDSRKVTQLANYAPWLLELRDRKLVVIEIGAGDAVPTVRWHSETVTEAREGFLIRINPREPQIPDSIPGVGINLGALEALDKIGLPLDT